ncbi:hypothetical protein F5144DRAFT_585429 [Chaetomium tenue]|uniref:Uncharacterized protein n=1 Tax=Chaetomium tenue TaxID=1854479 RepID=A0ACB7NXC5_9PEZI|nr:hypothetical protein F5144DRAFT_585429 [Chaetomium globosum]
MRGVVWSCFFSRVFGLGFIVSPHFLLSCAAFYSTGENGIRTCFALCYLCGLISELTNRYRSHWAEGSYSPPSVI